MRHEPESPRIHCFHYKYDLHPVTLGAYTEQMSSSEGVTRPETLKRVQRSRTITVISCVGTDTRFVVQSATVQTDTIG